MGNQKLHFTTQHKMPRRGGGFGGSRSSSPNRSAPTRTAPPPQQAKPQAPAQQQGGGFMSMMAGTMAQGLAFGAGSEVAHRVVGGMMGGSGHQQEQAPVQQQQQVQQQMPVCQMENNNFVECLKFNDNQIASCQNYFDALKFCEKNQGL